jgi:N-acetyl-anhydromuramyl-L-alanine amidase AmpD
MTFETENWPRVPAKWFIEPTVPRRVRVVVIHDMEFPERSTAAEDVARYFQNPRDAQGRPVQASAHICVDNNSIVQCVRDSHVAFAAPGCNQDGIQIELAGYAKQTRAEWLDAYGTALLDRAADATAQYCLKYELPVCHLTNTQLKNGGRGIIGHYQASAVYKKSDHGDPGPEFPWEHFMEQVSIHHFRRGGT